jgi:hypothetical protein
VNILTTVRQCNRPIIRRLSAGGFLSRRQGGEEKIIFYINGEPVDEAKDSA